VTATAARARRAPPAAKAPPAGSASDPISDFGREQAAIAMETSGAVWRGFEAARAIQQRTAQEASARHRTAAHDLRAAATPTELFSIPVALWQADLDAVSRSWQALVGAAFEAQVEILGCACSHLFDSGSAIEAASLVDAVDKLPAAAMWLWRPQGAATAKA
jgi:hypothetical protein